MLFIVLCIAAFPLFIFISYVLLLFITKSTGWSVSMADSSERSGATRLGNLPVDYSILIVTRGIGESLLSKLESISSLEGQERIADVLIGLDGAADSVLPDSLSKRLKAVESRLPIQHIECSEHIGKNAVINKMLPLATGSVLLFTDVDALVTSKALVVLGRWFEDPGVGAVAGLRVIVDRSKFASAQGSYVDFDTQVKNMEMRFLGNVTSCDGKLYAIRAALTQSIPLHVTDDTFIGLGAPLQNKRLVFDPNLIANIGRPAKNPAHEFDRRRRVTTRGLHSLVERRALFKFTHYGWYSYCLFANKVCRRFAPVSLALMLLIATFALGYAIGLLALLLISLLILTSFIYLNRGVPDKMEYDTDSSVTIAAAQTDIPKSGANPAQTTRPLSKKILAAGAYLLLGMSAMTLGAFDFLCGKKVIKWEPKKSV